MERRIPIRRHVHANITHPPTHTMKATGLRGALATVERQRHNYQQFDAETVELALHRGEGATKPGNPPKAADRNLAVLEC